MSIVNRLQIFYAVIALLAAVCLCGIFFLHYIPDWVTFPQENGEPSYGLWKACSRFLEDPDNPEPVCSRYWNYRWQREADLVHKPLKAAASLYIFGMFFNLLLFLFTAFVAVFHSKVDYYPGIPITLAVLTAVFYGVASAVMELNVKRRLILNVATNHTRRELEAPLTNGGAAIGAWIAVGASIINMFMGVVVLAVKPTKKEIWQEEEHRV